MANTAGISYEAKKDALAALVDGKTNLKASLYYTTATVGPSDAVHASSGECTGGSYAAATITNGVAAALDTDKAHWTPGANISFGTITQLTAFDCCQIWDDDDATGPDRALAVFTFSEQTVNNAPFSLTIPTNNGTTGLVRLV